MLMWMASICVGTRVVNKKMVYPGGKIAVNENGYREVLGALQKVQQHGILRGVKMSIPAGSRSGLALWRPRNRKCNHVIPLSFFMPLFMALFGRFPFVRSLFLASTLLHCNLIAKEHFLGVPSGFKRFRIFSPASGRRDKGGNTRRRNRPRKHALSCLLWC